MERTDLVPVTSMAQHSYPSAQVIDQPRLTCREGDLHLVPDARHTGRAAARPGTRKRRRHPIDQLSQSPLFVATYLALNTVTKGRGADGEGPVPRDRHPIAAATILILHCLTARLQSHREPRGRCVA